MFGIHCILCLYIYRHLLFTKVYLKGRMVLKLIIRWWFWWYHFWCIASAVSKSSWNCHLISSSQVADHSIVMVHWYGTWMTSMSSWLLFGYHQKYSHSTSVVTCRVCISPRVHQDNKAITIQLDIHRATLYCIHHLGGSQWSSLIMNVIWLWHELYPWRTMLLMRFFHLAPEGCLSHWIHMYKCASVWEL